MLHAQPAADLDHDHDHVHDHDHDHDHETPGMWQPQHGQQAQAQGLTSLQEQEPMLELVQHSVQQRQRQAPTLEW